MVPDRGEAELARGQEAFAELARLLQGRDGPGLVARIRLEKRER
jgi:hypothetical protein